MSYHTRTHSGDLLSRLLREVNQLRNFLTESALQLASESILALSLVGVMLWLNWRLALLAFLLFPVLFWAISRFSRDIRGFTRRRLKKESEVAATFSETLAAIQEAQLFGVDDAESDRFRSRSRSSYRAELKAVRSKGKLLRVVELVSASALCITLGVGANEVLKGVMTPGDLLVFVSYLRGLFKPVRRIARLSVQSAKAVVSAQRIIEVLETEPEIADAPDACPAPAFAGEIELRDVSFSYEREQPALEDISVRVRPGERVVLLGESGAGKSTLVSMIPRLRDPDRGSVLVDGVDIRDYTLASLRGQIAVTPQDPSLFSGSVRDNIAYADAEASDEAIRRAARLAHADGFIEAMPDGYDSEIGEGGVKLSGGQRQRIAIARALIRNAPIVILDEPLSGVDIEAENEILKALNNLLRGRTSFIIAHRLSTLLRADRVIVLERGKIVEAGSPKELFEASGRFRKLVELQVESESLIHVFETTGRVQ